MSDQRISQDTTGSISSPGSGAGIMPSTSRDGEIDPLCREAVHASLSARQAKALGLLTSGTYGLAGSGSSVSLAQTRSLANKLRQRLERVGSTLYSATWKMKASPARRWYSAHTASARTIYVNVFTGVLLLAPFPTPDANAMNDGESLASFRARQARLKKEYKNGNGAGMPLAIASQLVGWDKTPMASDGDGGVMEIRSGTTGKYKLRDFAQLAGWATATASKLTQSGDLQNEDGTPWNGTSKPYQNGKPVTTALGDQVKLAAFNTPMANGSIRRGQVAPSSKTLNNCASLSGFPTTRAVDGAKGQRTQAGMERERERRGKPPDDLPSVALMAGFPTTTTTRDSKSDGLDGPNRTGAPSLPGLIRKLFYVPIGVRAVLCPEFSLSLMLGPKAKTWAKAAPGYAAWSEMQAVLESEC